LVLLGVAIGLGGCSGGGGGNDGAPPTVIITPPQAVAKGELRQLSATVVDAAPGVNWTVEGGSEFGTIDVLTGIYTAPATLPPSPVVVRATSTDDPRGTATTTIRVVVGEEVTRLFNREISPAKASTFSGGQRSVAVRGSIVYVVWNDDHSGNDDVYLRVSRDRGVTFDNAVRINDDAALGGTRPQWYPSIGVDGSGRAVVAWLDGRHDPVDLTFDVYVATVTLDANGAAVVGPNQRVTLAGTPDAGDPSVALAVEQTGSIYLAWADGTGPNHTEILLTKGVRLSTGLFQFAPAVSVNENHEDDQGRPSVAVDTTGNVLVGWHSLRLVANQIEKRWDVYWRRGRFDTVGAIVWATNETRVNLETEADQVSPSVAVDSNGTAYIAWSQQVGLDERRRLYFAKSSAVDLTVTANLEVMQAESDQNFPSLVVAGSEVTIAVADNRLCSSCIPDSNPVDRNGTGATDVYVVRSVDGGLTFRQPEEPLNEDTSLKLHGRPSVAVDDLGRAYAVWTDDRNDASQVFMARAE
jgi:hypothetical protein